MKQNKTENIFSKLMPILSWLFVIGIFILFILVKIFGVEVNGFKKLGIFYIAFYAFIGGLWTILGVVYQWKSFKKSLKHSNFESLFGTVVGRILYLLLGILVCVLAIIIFYKTYNINHL